MATDRIPLFPLEVVLFPGMPLPLHIFEPRYKLMIRRAVERSAPFGVVLARDNGAAAVGCTAEVVRLVKTYDDGRMDIETLGKAPFRIREVYDELPYLEATVEMLADDPDPGPPSLAEELRSLFASCRRLLHGDPAPSPSPGEALLAYQVAASLPLDFDTLQELLEIRAEAERRRRLAERLTQWLPVLERRRRLRDAAAGNGHGLT
jgi:ATP-dependent Lon protease